MLQIIRTPLAADVVVIGTWLNTRDNCDEDGNCDAKVMVEKVVRGPSQNAFAAYGIVELGMCDTRSIPPETGAYGKYYLERGAAGGPFRLVEFVRRKRKP